MKPRSISSFTAYVGIDWADRKHDFCLQANGSDICESGTLEHTPEAIAQWAQSLYDRFGGPIAVCLELAKGPIVYALQRCDFFVIFPVHPSTLARYRQAFVPSGAKDDPSDAKTALDLLLRHPERLEPLKSISVPMRILSALVEERRHLTDGVTRITNRLTSTLKQYYPQALDWFEHRNTIMFCDFLNRWPTLVHVRRARTATLESFFHSHNCRREYLVSGRIKSIRSATPLTEDEAVIRPARMMVETLVAQLRVLLGPLSALMQRLMTSRTHHPALLLGWSLLPTAAKQRLFTRRRCSGACVQVDTHTLQNVEDENLLWRIYLLERAEKTRVAVSHCYSTNGKFPLTTDSGRKAVFHRQTPPPL